MIPRLARVRFPLRYHLVALVVIAVIPVLFFAGAILLDLSREQRVSIEQGLRTSVRALATAVDREIEASMRALEVLATSPLLTTGDLRAFHAQAVDVTRAEKGSLGLGLAIVRYLVELHGGAVRAESPGRGGGAVFTVELPALAVSPMMATVGRSEDAPARSDRRRRSEEGPAQRTP